MLLGDVLLAVKLKFLEEGGGCCKERGKKSKNSDITEKESKINFFFIENG